MSVSTNPRPSGPPAFPRPAAALLFTCSIFAGCALAGCARQRPAPPVRPPLLAVVTYALGSPVDPPPPGGAAAADPLVLRLEGYAVPPSAAPPGKSLAASGGLVLSPVNEPLAAAPSTIEAVRLVQDLSSMPAPGRRTAVRVGNDGPLPAGCTATVSFYRTGGDDRARAGAVLRVGIVSPSAAGRDRPRLLVTAAGPAPREPVTESEPPAGGERTLVLDWPLPSTAGEFALYVPADRRRGLRRPSVWRFRLEAADGAEAVQAAARVLAGLKSAPRSSPPGRGPLLASALAPTGDAFGLRSALLAVCAEVRGDVASEAALLLDDKALAPAAARVAEALAAAPPETDNAQLGWTVDRALLSGLALLAGGGAFPPELGAMMSARFGEAGRDPAALGELAAASPSRADFETRVRAENLILLDDSSPASRVRAFEWMSARNEAPPDYNPLGTPAERRAAIDEHLQSLGRQADTTTQPSSRPSTSQPSTSQPVR